MKQNTLRDMALSEPFRILIVDDQAMDIAPLKYLAWQLGIEVELAFSGNEAWGFMRQYKFDLVILDWQMPDGSGCEFLNRLEKFIVDNGSKSVCRNIVVHTGSPMDVNDFREINVRILDVWEKPITALEMIKKLSKYQARKGA
jgi:CheY-like chemotaxis protein